MVISGLAIIVLLIGAPSAYAQVIHSDRPQADFKSGYDHGIADASDPCKDPRIPCIAYVWKLVCLLDIEGNVYLKLINA